MSEREDPTLQPISSAILILDYLQPLAEAAAVIVVVQRIFTRASLCDYQDRIRSGKMGAERMEG